jgi:fatty-acyl-CoA synthase
MKVALTVNDFLRRAELVYPKRIGIVDEPDQPAESWGSLTYAQVAAAGARDSPRTSTPWASASGRARGDGEPELGPSAHLRCSG